MLPTTTKTKWINNKQPHWLKVVLVLRKGPCWALKQYHRPSSLNVYLFGSQMIIMRLSQLPTYPSHPEKGRTYKIFVSSGKWYRTLGRNPPINIGISIIVIASSNSFGKVCRNRWKSSRRGHSNCGYLHNSGSEKGHKWLEPFIIPTSLNFVSIICK